MTIKFEFRDNGVIMWHSANITGSEVLQANSDVYSHKYDRGLEFQLIDLSEVSEFHASSSDMMMLAKMDRDVKKDKKQFACVVTPSDLLFGISRQWSIQSEGDDFETNVVRSIHESIIWLESKGISVSI